MLTKRIINAINKTPFYRDHGYIVSENWDKNLFTVTKSDVVNFSDDFHSQIPMTTSPITVSTSGSSGCPIDIIWNPIDYYSSLVEIWKYRKKIGVSPCDNFVTAHISFNNGGRIYTNKAIVQKNSLSLSKVFFDEETLLFYYKQILEFQPVWMLLPPSFLYGFIVFLEQRNFRLPASIKLVELTGEYCTSELFTYFKKTYPEFVWRLTYGMQEFNVIGYGTPEGLCVLKNNVMVEILNDKNLHCEANEEGSVVVTGLKNTAMPLLRYKTGDYGYIDASGMLHITRSRSNDILITDNGVYDGSLFWLIILKAKKELKLNIWQFQVVFEKNTLYFYLKIDSLCKIKLDILKNYISSILLKQYNIDYDVVLRIVDVIYPLVNGNKIKFFINSSTISGGNHEK